MSDRFENFLLNRLRREAARDAIDVALAKGWLADEDEQETEPDAASSGRRGHFFDDDDNDDPRRSSVRRLKLGPKLEGLSGDEVARLLARDGIHLDPPRVAVQPGGARSFPLPSGFRCGTAWAGPSRDPRSRRAASCRGDRRGAAPGPGSGARPVGRG